MHAFGHKVVGGLHTAITTKAADWIRVRDIIHEIILIIEERMPSHPTNQGTKLRAMEGQDGFSPVFCPVQA